MPMAKNYNFEELDIKCKKIVLRALKKSIQKKIGIKISIERVFLKRMAKQHKFLKNGEIDTAPVDLYLV